MPSRSDPPDALGACALGTELPVLYAENEWLRAENDRLRAENDSLQTENDVLQAEVRVSRDAAVITTDLVIGQFEQTERLLTRVRNARAERDAIFDAASKVAIIATDLDGLITLFSRGAELMLGRRAVEVVGRMRLIDFHVPAEVESAAAARSVRLGRQVQGWELFTDGVQARGSEAGEWTLVRRSGRGVPVRLSVTGLRDAEDQIVGYVGAAIDISATRNTERELRRRQAELVEAKRRLVDIINLLPDATMVIDADGTVMFWNRAMERLSGIPAAEMVGRGDYEYALAFYGERRPILIDLVVQPDAFVPGRYTHVEIDGDTMTAETVIPNLRGRRVYLRGSASVLRNAAGEVAGAIETIFDITERREMMMALEVAKEEAIGANNAKSLFFATMSHELRTPLNAIIGFADFVAQEAFGPVGDREYIEHAGYARDSAKHLLDMVNAILDLSKIEAGMMTLERVRLPVAPLVRRCARMVEDLALRAGVEIRVAAAPNLEDIWADERALRQILINLLANAIKFNVDRGSILVTALEAGDAIEIVVADTGAGIPRDSIERMRRPFEQANTQYSRAHGGSGLGLSIVDGLVRLHGGTLLIDSEVGKGTAVTVRFPKTDGESQAVPSGQRGS